ncbi:unnamed protein product [Rotaria sp. Silwood1]|nr:unnamed protein product [Rotaria sp. Silwood1]CAF1496194.1 unnamed protein product [Rotaria sp. Silwood1]CAF3693506.1 unnamed protein product [Rotaria sp. Silwood1]CAF4654934.1 unnamed protein product [Rotaria sp. Silwood1]
MASYGATTTFHDRIDAGRRLATHSELQRIKLLPPSVKRSYIVISLPRGGTVVGDEIAKLLGITHDLVFPRKIPLPGHSEVAIGAVSEFGDVIWNDDAKQYGLFNHPRVQQSKNQQIVEAQRRKQVYRGRRQPMNDLTGKTVILVDDGLATGATMKSAINTCKRLNATSIIVAVPCGPNDILQEIRPFVNKIICLAIPYGFRSVGQCYYSFPQTTDEEVIEIMKKYQDSSIFY